MHGRRSSGPQTAASPQQAGNPVTNPTRAKNQAQGIQELAGVSRTVANGSLPRARRLQTTPAASRTKPTTATMGPERFVFIPLPPKFQFLLYYSPAWLSEKCQFPLLSSGQFSPALGSRRCILLSPPGGCLQESDCKSGILVKRCLELGGVFVSLREMKKRSCFPLKNGVK